MKKWSGTIFDGERRPEGRGAGTEPRTREENSVVTECELPDAPDKVWKALTVPKLLAPPPLVMPYSVEPLSISDPKGELPAAKL